MGSFKQIQPVLQVGSCTTNGSWLIWAKGGSQFWEYNHRKELLVLSCFLVSNMTLLRVFLNPQKLALPETRKMHMKR